MPVCEHPQLEAESPPTAANLRRLLADAGLTIAELAERSAVDARTLKGILSGAIARPHARTLHRLATALSVSASEFFQTPALLARRHFDRQSNPEVESVVAEHPTLFAAWTTGDFDELYSRFGTGGALSREGTLEVASAINRRRALLDKVTLLLETGESELLAQMVDVLYERVTRELRGPADDTTAAASGAAPHDAPSASGSPREPRRPRAGRKI